MYSNILDCGLGNLYIEQIYWIVYQFTFANLLVELSFNKLKQIIIIKNIYAYTY